MIPIILAILALGVLVGPVFRLDVRLARADARRGERLLAAIAAMPQNYRLSHADNAEYLRKKVAKRSKQAAYYETSWENCSLLGGIWLGLVLIVFLVPFAIVHVGGERAVRRYERVLRKQRGGEQ